MSPFPFAPPAIDEDERVHAAYRFASLCWRRENEATLILDGISGPPVFANPIKITRAQYAVSRAEDRTFEAVESYLRAIRAARRDAARAS